MQKRQICSGLFFVLVIFVGSVLQPIKLNSTYLLSVSLITDKVDNDFIDEKFKFDTPTGILSSTKIKINFNSYGR